MGMDAWTLASHFNELRQVSGYQVAGQTGLLSASENCTVHRQLNWLRYQNGGLLPVSMSVDPNAAANAPTGELPVNAPLDSTTPPAATTVADPLAQ
ncbi:MAG: penicillin-binding protein activator, partial [Plesiomonas shigelloides]